jgi:hypothetical protein
MAGLEIGARLYDQANAQPELFKSEQIALTNDGKTEVRQVSTRSNANESWHIQATQTFTRDEYYRRVTNDQQVLGIDSYRQPKPHIIFFGCSYTYGDVLSDNETLPFLINRETYNQFNVYNYASSGFSTSNMLSKLRDPGFKHQINGDSGIAIYVYIYQHATRNVGDMQSFTMDWWPKAMPYFKYDDNGNLYQDGYLDNSPNAGLYRFLNSFSLVKLAGLNLPLSNDSQYKFTADMIIAAQKEYLAKFPQGRFYVLIHPLTDRANVPEITKYTQKAEINFIDGIDLVNQEFDRSFVTFDNAHPSAHINSILASRLTEYLNLLADSDV